MVTSVNGSSLAALLAQENALANRTAPAAPARDGESQAGQAHDPAVVYSGAAGAPSLSAILSVQDSLNRAASISDVGLNAGQTISDLLALARGKAAAAQSASPDDRATLGADYQQLLQTIDQMAGSASFQGVTMLNGAATGDLSFKADPAGEATVSLTPLDLTTTGLGLAGTSLAGSSEDLAALLDQLDGATASVSAQLSQLTAQSDQIHAHLGVLGRLQSALAGGASADLDADGARLQALQIQQMLSQGGSAVANQAPQALLSLFRT